MDITSSLKHKASSEGGDQKHSLPMLKDNMVHILAWSQKTSPKLDQALGWLHHVLSGHSELSLIHVHAKKWVLVKWHLEQITFSAIAWTLWTREVLQLFGDECALLKCLYYRCFELVNLRWKNITIFDEAAVDHVLAKYLAGDELLLSDQQILFEIYLTNCKGWQKKVDKSMTKQDLHCAWAIDLRTGNFTNEWTLATGHQVITIVSTHARHTCHGRVPLAPCVVEVAQVCPLWECTWTQWLHLFYDGCQWCRAPLQATLPQYGPEMDQQGSWRCLHSWLFLNPLLSSWRCSIPFYIRPCWLVLDIGEGALVGWVGKTGGFKSSFFSSFLTLAVNSPGSRLITAWHPHLLPPWWVTCNALALIQQEINQSLVGEAALVQPMSTKELQMVHSLLAGDIWELWADMVNIAQSVHALMEIHVGGRNVNPSATGECWGWHSDHTDVCTDPITLAPILPWSRKQPTKPLMIVIPPHKSSGVPICAASTTGSWTMASGSSPHSQAQAVVQVWIVTAHTWAHSATSDPNDIPTMGLYIPNVQTLTVDGWRDMVRHWVHSAPEPGLETPLKDWPKEWLTGANQHKFTMEHYNCLVIAKKFLNVWVTVFSGFRNSHQSLTSSFCSLNRYESDETHILAMYPEATQGITTLLKVINAA